MARRREIEKASSPEPKLRVAVVDDFRLLIEGLVARLNDVKNGIDVVIEATRWPDLVSHPQFPAQVTVLDLNLNDSISIGTKIQALLSAGSQVVVISRHSDAATVARVMSAGALSYIPKSQGVDELVVAIHSAARGESYLAEQLQAAIAEISTTPAPKLGRQEQRALALYAGGMSMREVGGEMGTTEETVKSYVKRARRKYRDIGIELGSRAQLRIQGVHEGWFDVE